MIDFCFWFDFSIGFLIAWILFSLLFVIGEYHEEEKDF